MILKSNVPAIGIVTGYPVPPVIAVPSVLRDSRGRLEFTSVRPDAQIKATQIEFFP